MGKRTAVVVGINYDKPPQGSTLKQYKARGFQPLRYAEADATAMAEVLEQAGYMVQVLRGPDATRANILKTVKAQRDAAGANGLLLFHFSGHGDVDADGTAYLLPADADPAQLDDRGISYEQLLGKSLAGIEQAIALIDCCHSGHAAGVRGGAIADPDPAFLAEAQKSYTRGRVVLTACAGSQKAWELSDLQHGAFTFYALQEFQQNRSQVDVESLFGHINRGLLSRKLHQAVRGGSQQGTIVLREALAPELPAPAAPPPAAATTRTPAPPPDVCQRYKAYLCARYELADLRGLVREEHASLHANSVRLRAIYVPLRASVGTRHPIEIIHAAGHGSFRQVTDLDLLALATARWDEQSLAPLPPTISLLNSALSGESQIEEKTDPKIRLHVGTQAPAPREHVELDHLLTTAPLLVVLGDPGSGKSTALKRYLLDALAAEDGPLPLLVPLAAYAKDLKDEPALSIVEFAARYYAAREVPGLLPLFEYARDMGQLVYLLDGLDEVPGDLRGQVSDMVTALAPHLDGNRLVATSRLTGYVPLALRDYQEATIERLAPDQIAAFVQNWYAAFFAGRPTLGAEARQTADRLLEIIETNPGVAKLADNPLTLTMLALLFFAGNAELPRRRVKLYGYVARTLIADWHRARNLAGIPVGSAHDELEVLQQVGPLAYWMHEHKPEGRATRDEVAHVLAQVERTARPDEDPMPRVFKFLEVLSAEVGLLSEKGAGQWGFSHQTFQEYFAAREIARRPRKMAAEIARRAPDPRWTEVIRLAIAYLGSETGATEDVTELVTKAILKRRDPYERYLHRNLLLACRVLSDDPGVPLPAALPLARRLFDLWSKTWVSELQESAEAILRDLLGTSLYDSILSWFQEKIAAKKVDWHLSLVAGEPEIQSVLLPLLADPDPRVRSSTADALSGVAADPAVKAALLPLLADPDSDVRQSAIQALHRLAAEPMGQAVLLPLLADPDLDVCESVVQALRTVAAEPAGQVALLPLLVDPTPTVRRSVVQALEAVAAEPVVQAALLPLLGDPDSGVRRSTIQALGGLAAKATVQFALLPLLGDPDSSVRQGTVQALGVVAAEPAVLAALVPLLTDPDSGVRGSTALALRKLAAEPVVQAALLPLLTDSVPTVRRSSVQALGARAAAPSVQVAILPLLADSVPTVRRSAVQALEAVAVEPAVQAALLPLLADPNSGVRESTVKALGVIIPPAIQDALLPLLTDPAPAVRRSVVQALEAVAVEPAVQAALLPLLADPNSDVRMKAIIVLSTIAGDFQLRARALSVFNELLEKDLPQRQVIEALGYISPDPALRQRLGTWLNDYGVADAAFATLTRWATVEDAADAAGEAADG